MRLAAVRYLVNRFLLRRRTLVTHVPHYDFRMRVVTRDVVGRHIYKYGAHEPEYTAFLGRELNLKDRDVALDVGAHVGWYSLVLDQLAAGTSARVFAFEPDPVNYALLIENLDRNAAHTVTPVPQAVADVSGTRTLHLFDDTNRGRHSLLPIQQGASLEVETVALDDFWTQAKLAGRHPAFLKVDVEGFELAVLQGARRLLGDCPLVMAEYSPHQMRVAGVPVRDLFDLMAGHGYRLFHVVNGGWHPADAAALIASDGPSDLFWRK